MAFALALQCSTNWAMKTHTLEAGQFLELILTRKRSETYNGDDYVVSTPLSHNSQKRLAHKETKYREKNDQKTSESLELLINILNVGYFRFPEKVTVVLVRMLCYYDVFVYL